MMKAIAFILSLMIVLMGAGYLIQNQEGIIQDIDDFNNKLRLLSLSQTPAPYVPIADREEYIPPADAPEEVQEYNFSFTAMYPNSNLTPGDVMSTDWNLICSDGYSASVRDVSTSKKKEVYARYGLNYPPPTGTYECDHMIPLSIGGSNELTNLWPEAEEPRPGFREKDVVEAALHRAVCHEKLLTLEQAQQAIVNDWYQVYVQYGYAMKDITPTEEDN
jgi:hypothetical protein